MTCKCKCHDELLNTLKIAANFLKSLPTDNDRLGVEVLKIVKETIANVEENNGTQN